MSATQSYLSVLLTFVVFSIPIYASGASLTFVPGSEANSGWLSCELPVQSLGTLQFKNGLALIDGRKISVQGAVEFYESPHTLLTGKVLRTEADVAMRKCTITGLALFVGGEGLEKLNQGDAEDVIFTHGGAIYGKLVGVTDHQVRMLQKSGLLSEIDFSSVTLIRSPRACVFTVTGRIAQPIQPVTPFSAELESAAFKVTGGQRVIPTASVIPLSERQDESDEDAGYYPARNSRFFPGQLDEEPSWPFPNLR